MTAPNDTIIIGLAGKKRVGKSTIAEVLCREHDFCEIILAGPLKAGLGAMFAAGGIDDFSELPKEQIIPELSVSPRHLMQTLGTEWGRRLVRDDIWLVMAENRMRRDYRIGNKRFVVSDIRFENEAAWVRSLGGVVMHIHNPRLHAVQDDHASEAGVEFLDGDAFFNNSRDDLRGLEKRLAALMEVWPRMSQDLIAQRKAIQA